MTNTDRSPVIKPTSGPDIGSPKSRVTMRRLFLAAAFLVLLVAFGIVQGIHSRVAAASDLNKVARESAIPVVEVVHPKVGAAGQEIELPGNAQAFNDTPSMRAPAVT